MSLYNNLIQNKILKGVYNSKDVLILAFIILYVNLSVSSLFLLNGKSYPYNTFLNNPNSTFEELFRKIDGLKITDTWENSTESTNILTPTEGTLYIFLAKLIIIGNKYVLLLSLYAIILFAVSRICKRHEKDQSIFLLVILSYPMLFALGSGSIVSLAIFLLLFFALTKKQIPLATLALALSASLKFPTLIFILPILFNKPLTFRGFVNVFSYFLLWFILINLIAVQINNHFLVPSVLSSISFFQGVLKQIDQTHLTGFSYGSSLFMPVSYFIHSFQILSWLKSYQLTIIVLSALGVWLSFRGQFIVFLKKLQSAKNALFFSCLSFIVFMPYTEDYYLLILLLPLIIYPNTSFSFGYFLVFGLLLGAKNLLFFQTTLLGSNFVSLQVFINPLLLMLLLLAEFNLIDFINRDDSKSTANDSIVIQFLIKTGAEFPGFINRYKKRIVLFFGIILSVSVLMFRIQLAHQETHNSLKGMPIDFDPEIYLELNPGLEEFWNSVGIKHESKQALFDHAELHYIGFGSNEGWKYQGIFQKIFYNKYLRLNYIIWQLYIIPVILLLFAFINTFIKRERMNQLLNSLRLHKIKIIAIFGIIILVSVGVISAPYGLRMAHNKEIGLPLDFDPEMYLKLNPELEKFWESNGVKHQSKRALLDHAEMHYRDFGAKDGWRYK